MIFRTRNLGHFFERVSWVLLRERERSIYFYDQSSGTWDHNIWKSISHGHRSYWYAALRGIYLRRGFVAFARDHQGRDGIRDKRSSMQSQCTMRSTSVEGGRLLDRHLEFRSIDRGGPIRVTTSIVKMNWPILHSRL